MGPVFKAPAFGDWVSKASSGAWDKTWFQASIEDSRIECESLMIRGSDIKTDCG